MKKQKNEAIIETIKFGIGEIIVSALAAVVFVLLEKMSLNVVIGLVIGCAVCIGNFFFMATGLLKTAETESDPVAAGNKMKISYIIRMFCVGGIIAFAYVVGKFNIIALLLPFVFSRAVMMVQGLIGKSGDEK